MATQVNAVKPTTIALNLAQNNTVTERRVYRVLGRNGTIMRKLEALAPACARLRRKILLSILSMLIPLLARSAILLLSWQ